MDLQEPYWTEQLKETPFREQHMREEIKQRIRLKIRSGAQNNSKRKQAKFVIAAASLLVVLACCSIIFNFMSSESPLYEDMEERHAFYHNEKLLFEVFPDPALEAGHAYGYIFRFTAPLQEFQGKMLSIHAVHLNTGLEVTAMPPVLITEPSSGYLGLERFTTVFALPLEGKWRYEIKLDDMLYGDVVLNVGRPSWKISTTFKSGSYMLRGIEGKVGIIDPGFIAGQGNKYMWHFWGETEELQGELSIMAVKQGDDKLLEVFKAKSLGGANNGADRHIPSSMSLPESGLWRLIPFIDGRMLESIVVEVKENRPV